MSDIGFWQALSVGLGFVLVLYVCARLVSHAWFKSRADYERKKSHE